MRPAHLTASNQTAIACGYLAAFLAGHAIHALATPYYQMMQAIDPFLLSLVLTVPLLFSMLLSHRIGAYCDRLDNHAKQQLLRLAGWVAGALFSCLWLAPDTWSETASLGYLAACCVFFYLAVSVLNINLRSMTYAVSYSSAQSLTVMSFAALFERAGAIMYFWLFPLAQLSIWHSVHTGVRVVGATVGLGLIGLLTHIAATLFRAPPQSHGIPSAVNSFSSPDKVTLATPVRQALLILLTLIVIKVGLVSAVTSMDFYLLVYFVADGDIGQGAFWKGVLSTSFAIFSLILIPPFLKLSMRIGPLSALKWIYTLSLMGAVAKWFIYTPDNEYWIILDALLGAASFVALTAIVPAMINQLSLKQSGLSGRAVHGYFAARQSAVAQGSIVTALLLGGMLLNIIGFDASLGPAQSDDTITLLRILLAGGSAALNGLSLLLIMFYPPINFDTTAISETHHLSGGES